MVRQCKIKKMHMVIKYGITFKKPHKELSVENYKASKLTFRSDFKNKKG